MAAPSTNPWASRRVRRQTIRPIDAMSSTTSSTSAMTLPPEEPGMVPVAMITRKLPTTYATNPTGTPTSSSHQFSQPAGWA